VGAIRGLWRWRRNPLRRATDLVEAWLALVVLLLVLVAAPVIGSLVGASHRTPFSGRSGSSARTGTS
jgi:hypothetical protein